jgi:hypothetical protein
MRWATYNRLVEKFDFYEATLNKRVSAALEKYMARHGGAVVDGIGS